MTRKMEKIDKGMLYAVILSIVTVVVINFITSYGHIYVEGLHHGEYGTDARLMPIGIDGMLLALGLANVFASRFKRNHWLLRSALAFGVAGTVAANGAYGAGWGITGGLMATWSPVALFITVESGLFMFRVVADVIEEQAKQAEIDARPKVGRPRGSRNSTTAPKNVPGPRNTDPQGQGVPGTEVAIPVIRGRVDPLDPFHALRVDARPERVLTSLS